jgi:PAS domain S-box-containing protein
MGEAFQTQTPDTRLFRDVFNASPIGIAVENIDGQPLFVNPAFCSMLGFTEEELRSKHCVDFSPPEDAARDWALFQQLRAGSIDHYQIEKRYFRRDGSLLWGLLSISLLNSPPSPLVIAMVQDITEKKKAEESLLRHAAIVESSEDAIISKNLDAVIMSWNSGAQRIFGYTEAEAVGQPITLLIPPELRDEEKNILKKLKAGESIERYETKRLTKTGRKVDVSLTMAPIKDSAGNIVGFSNIEHDITQRKRAEEALRASEERLRLAQQAAHIGAFEWNIRTGIDTWTPELELMHGLPPGGFSGMQTAWENLLHPDDRARVLEMVDESLRTGEANRGEWRVIWPDGSVHWIVGRWQVLMDESGQASRMVGINIDVTARKQMEKALLEANRTLQEQAAILQSREELLKIFVKHVPAGVAMFDRDMRYLQVSDRWCSDYSVDSPEILGRSHYELFPDVPQRWKDVHRLALAGETVRAEEDRWERKDGTITWVQWEIRPWRKESGEVGGILIFAEHITHRKQMEEALSVMTRKLIEAQEQERARIGRELHDDINQQLAMLAVELDQLQQSPAEIPSGVQEIQNRIKDVSADVQALSHDLHSSKLEILGVAAGIKSWCREFADRQKVEIDFKSDVSSVLPFELGLSLFRVLQEALHNSMKHSGVRHFKVRLTERQNEVHLTVSDSGTGFDVEAALQGKGLGLTSMRERVRLVNGKISVESKPMGGGTTVHVHVPFKGKEPSHLAAGD